MAVDLEANEGIDVTDVNDGGVIKIINKEGTGSETPSEGASVFVHYVGKFPDGTEFDSSRGRGRPLDFILGREQVIPAWELTLETMKKGEICTVTCKPEYAYGKAGRPPTIPENATLMFEIELLYWSNESVTADSLVSKKILKRGKGTESVDIGGTVDVHLIGRDGERVFDERDVRFVVGEGSEYDVIPGVDAAVKTMKKGETCLITVDCSHAFGDKGRPEWGIGPNTSLAYEIHLKSFEQLTPPWELSSEERMESAKLAKVKGTEYFKKENYSMALSKFDRVVSLVESLTHADELEQASPMILTGHLNVALCYLKLGKHLECAEACDKALYRDENNVKALYRKARAKFAMHYLDESKELFQRVLKLDPKNKDARSYYSQVKKKLEEHKIKEKKVFANMFDKFAARDAEIEARAREQDDGKDVFERAKEEAKTTFGEEPSKNSDDVATKTSDEKGKQTPSDPTEDGKSATVAEQSDVKTSPEETSKDPTDGALESAENNEAKAE